jgi:predicted hotdog family 3-hydroxylacyl-ACP dehydratase
MDKRTSSPEDLVPHRGHALFLRRVLRCDASGIECVGVIPGGHPFVHDGHAPAFVGLELAAQAAAALQALESPASPETPRPGYLVGVREAHFKVASLPADLEIHARVRRTGRAGPLSVHDVLVEIAGVECLSGVISTYAR